MLLVFLFIFSCVYTLVFSRTMISTYMLFANLFCYLAMNIDRFLRWFAVFCNNGSLIHLFLAARLVLLTHARIALCIYLVVERCSVPDIILLSLSGDVPQHTGQSVDLLRLSGKCDLFNNVVFIVSEACTIPLSGTRYLWIFVTLVKYLWEFVLELAV